MNVERRVGVWLVGGRGSVATTTMTGAAAIAAGLAEPTGLVTMRGAVRGRGPRPAQRPRLRRSRRRRDAAGHPRGAPRRRRRAARRPARRARRRARGRRVRPAARHHRPRSAAGAAGRPGPHRHRPQRVPHAPRSDAGRRHQRVLDRGARRPAPGARRSARPDGRAGPEPADPAPERALRAGGDRDGLRLRGLHALGRRAPARDRGARRGARGAAGRQRRQDRRDVHEVRARAGIRPCAR